MGLYLTHVEHQVIPVSTAGSAHELSEQEAHVLTKIGESRQGFCERGYKSIRVNQYCGVVNLGNRVLEILPKAGTSQSDTGGRDVIMRLLKLADGYSAFRVADAGQTVGRATLLEMFIGVFMDSVATIVRGGLMKQYREREDDLRVVRGRIVLSRQFTSHFNRSDIIASRFDDHTADNVWNRAVKAALRACRPWIRSADLVRRWVELLAAFDEVVDIRMQAGDLDRLKSDRQVARYKFVLVWVRWILATLSPSLRVGGEDAPSFLFDMNRLFERAFARSLQRKLAVGDTSFAVRLQPRHRHLAVVRGTQRKAFPLQPDILISRTGTPIAVVDTKWKLVDVNGSGYLLPSRSDVYQMHSYAAAFHVDRVILVYPVHSAARTARETVYTLPGARAPTLHVVCVDVESEDLPIVVGGATCDARKLIGMDR